MDVLLVERAFLTKEEKILFARRSPDHKHNPGLWEIPGGQVKKGELPENSIRREIKEEVGQLVVKRKSPPVACHMWRYITDEGEYAGMLYLAHYSVFAVLEGEVELSQEHDDVAWLTWNESFRSPNLNPETLFMLGVMARWLP